MIENLLYTSKKLSALNSLCPRVKVNSKDLIISNRAKINGKRI